MIQVISYTNGLVGLQNINHSKAVLKINNVEFEVGSGGLISISEVPEEILQRVTLPSAISHYEFEGKNIDPVEFEREKARLLGFRMETIHDGEYSWPADKLEEYTTLMKYRPVYKDPEPTWQPVGFSLVKQEFVPEQYAEYIVSTVIVDTIGLNLNTRAICTYTSNAHKMLLKVAGELGFKITSNEHEKGKCIFPYTNSLDSVLKFSKVDGEYFKIPRAEYESFKNFRGTLDECIRKYNYEYGVIHKYLQGVAHVMDNKNLDPEERKNLMGLVDRAISKYGEVSSKANSGVQYRNLGKLLYDMRAQIIGTDKIKQD